MGGSEKLIDIGDMIGFSEDEVPIFDSKGDQVEIKQGADWIRKIKICSPWAASFCKWAAGSFVLIALAVVICLYLAVVVF